MAGARAAVLGLFRGSVNSNVGQLLYVPLYSLHGSVLPPHQRARARMRALWR